MVVLLRLPLNQNTLRSSILAPFELCHAILLWLRRKSPDLLLNQSICSPYCTFQDDHSYVFDNDVGCEHRCSIQHLGIVPLIEKPLIYFLVDSRDVRVAALHKRNIIIRPHVDNIASGPIQVVHGTSNIEIATYATKSLAQYCPMLVGTDFFKKSVYEFARLTFSVIFVANLRGQFCSDKREHHLKRGSSLGN